MKKSLATILNLAAAKSDRAHARDILSQLPSPHLSRLMKAGKSKRLLRGEVLFDKGEPGDSCYWVMKGTLKVGVSSDTGEERIFSLLGPGSVVGELAILDICPARRRLPQSATTPDNVPVLAGVPATAS